MPPAFSMLRSARWKRRLCSAPPASSAPAPACPDAPADPAAPAPRRNPDPAAIAPDPIGAVGRRAVWRLAIHLIALCRFGCRHVLEHVERRCFGWLYQHWSERRGSDCSSTHSAKCEKEGSSIHNFSSRADLSGILLLVFGVVYLCVIGRGGLCRPFLCDVPGRRSRHRVGVIRSTSCKRLNASC
jgi:hypothetical protein